MFRCLIGQSKALCLLITLMMVAVCPAASAASQRQSSRRPAAALSPEQAQSIIAARAGAVADALRRRDMRGLARFVHPTRGVRFSPQPGVLPSDAILTRRELMSAWRDPRPDVWGETEAGEINLTFRQYFAQYVYNHDYARAGQVSYNRPRGHGNNVNTLRENYPRALLVEYLVTGSDPSRDGMDWGSLWLVFERVGSQWFLVGIAHDEWAI